MAAIKAISNRYIMKNIQQKPEIWGGIECTINRLKSGYKDQLELNGHYYREDDIDAIADLGITTLRYPVIWEKHQPKQNMTPDFSWVKSRLEMLRKRNVKPIAGLLHHGSGPEFTNMLDPKFPELLASYAKIVATEFPWIEMYTPVNEPLTTARFSGLYGFWYPHGKNDASFAVMLLNELKAVVLSMAEIRKINPKAQLVQTEDMGKAYSTPLLKYQADLENRRRFLTHDILCGRLDRNHVLWSYFMRLGIPESSLDFFLENPCPPDILGVNYYTTSERFLDEDMSKYPKSRYGSNSLHRYADVEAIRVKFDEPHGFPVLVKELWDRYNIPIAVTEAHLHCSRESQMKWFMEIYESSAKLCSEGVDIKAVTVWSMLGSYGWNKLLLSDEMEYERGTFDVSSGKRRPTAMASMIRTLAETGTFSSDVMEGDAWWKCENRYFPLKTCAPQTFELTDRCRPVLIIGKNGTLGKALSRICTERALNHVLLSRADIDICNPKEIERAIEKYKPWAVINAAGFVRVDEAEVHSGQCFMENTTGAKNLAAACKKREIQFMTFSSDLVFDGKKQTPYVESDAVNPLNVYGQSKADAEKVVSEIYPDSLLIRTSAFFSAWDQYNFAHAVIQTLEQGNTFEASEEIISPTYVPHLVDAALDLLIDKEKGIWHLANRGEISWYNFAKKIASNAGLDSRKVKKARLDLPAKRPAYSALVSENGLLMPTLDVALEDYFVEMLVEV